MAAKKKLTREEVIAWSEEGGPVPSVLAWDDSKSELAAPEALIPMLRDMVLRLATMQYPCLNCTFALATYGKYDAAFGIGSPRLCNECYEDDDCTKDEDWRPVPSSNYIPLVADALKMIDTPSKVEETIRANQKEVTRISKMTERYHNGLAQTLDEIGVIVGVDRSKGVGALVEKIKKLV